MEKQSRDIKKEDTKKKRKARATLWLFYKQLQKKCGSFKKVDDWYSYLKSNLDPILHQYKDVLPQDFVAHVEKAQNLTDTTQAALNKACANLRISMEQVIRALPKGSPLAKVLFIGVAATAGFAAAAVLYINVKSVTIHIKNQGCAPLTPPTSAVVSFPGLKLFNTPIPDGGQDVVTLFPVSVTVDARQPGSIVARALGFSVPVNFGSSASEVSFNGESLIGKQTELRLSDQSTHNLVIRCN